jgi:ParB-like chromosome segregation protein Spo0J
MADRKSGEINTANLILDIYNPRLYGETAQESQDQIMTKIYQRESIDELASSLAVNGYFQEEPIIVVPQNEDDFEKINATNLNEFQYIVIEGNRRTTSVKLLLNTANTIVDSDFPKISEGIDPEQNPCNYL